MEKHTIPAKIRVCTVFEHVLVSQSVAFRKHSRWFVWKAPKIIGESIKPEYIRLILSSTKKTTLVQVIIFGTLLLLAGKSTEYQCESSSLLHGKSGDFQRAMLLYPGRVETALKKQIVQITSTRNQLPKLDVRHHLRGANR